MFVFFRCVITNLRNLSIAVSSKLGSSFVQTNSQPCDFFIVLYSVWYMLSGFQFARIRGVSGLGVFDRAFVLVACRFPLTSQKFIVSFAKLGNSETIYPRVHWRIAQGKSPGPFVREARVRCSKRRTQIQEWYPANRKDHHNNTYCSRNSTFHKAFQRNSSFSRIASKTLDACSALSPHFEDD